MINMIVAIDEKNGIGKNNKLLYHSRTDLEYFKSVTYNNTIVMGYNTYLSLPKRPLPYRRNIILTTKDIELEGCEVIHSVEDLFKIIRNDEEVFICGGATLYNQFMKYADYLYITTIFETFDADTFFPKIEQEEWNLEKSYTLPQMREEKYDLQFKVYKRIK